ncbi:MAG: FAD-dependent oxidoreductase [Candidatus Sumerlaeota bacterium]|nr:FAD-dependent oxidoreductase [Candidatus Sumerlaeota bacterium]
MGISRRSFITSTGAMAVAGALGSGALPKLNAESAPAPPDVTDASKTKSISLPRLSLPILGSAEVVIVGGSFAGIYAALEFAKAGHSVILIEPRTYLGREMTSTLQPWAFVDRPPITLEEVKVRSEDLLLKAGVEIIYGSYPIGLCMKGNSLEGLIIGAKSGRQVIRCRMIVDTTETAEVMRLAGMQFDPLSDNGRLCSFVIEFDHVLGWKGNQLEIPSIPGIDKFRAIFHQGARGPEHVFIEFRMRDGVAEYTVTECARREIEVRKHIMAWAEAITSKVPEFKGATVAAISPEIKAPFASRLKCETPDWAKGLPSLNRHLAYVEINMANLAGPVKGLWCLPESAQLPFNLRWGDPNPIDGPLWKEELGKFFASVALSNWNAVIAEAPPKSSARSGASDRSDQSDTSDGLRLKEPNVPQIGRRNERYTVPADDIPVLREVDVLVVGGGTSGATAAAVSAREGMKTLLLEMNPALGGTGTLGGVDKYWFGRRVGFSTRVAKRVKEVQDSIHHTDKGGRWNIEAKMHALLLETQDAGAEVWFNTIVTGAIVEGGNVRGVMAATRFGPCVILAKVVLDATGDGDVAAFAGADCVYGSRMDHFTMWYSLAQFTSPGRNSNNFTSSVVVSDVRDYTRAILAGRRRGKTCHDHGIYVAPRESRHIHADIILTLTDQLRQRRWPDVVNIHYSNHDIKGKSSSQWVESGLIPPNNEVEIPYRALLPKELENILVAGKAFSATHDALPAIRMQSDLENLGGVVALAAAQAVKEGKSPRQIEIAQLQRRLVKEGLLPETVLTRELKPRRYSDAQLKELVAAMIAAKPLTSYQDMKMGDVFRDLIPFVEVCTAGAQAVPILEEALKTAPSDGRIVIAQALAMLGSQAGVPVLIEKIESQLAGGKVPARKPGARYAGLPPDQGAMPEVCYWLYSLGLARDRRSLSAWRRVADLLDPKEGDFKKAEESPYHYVDSICFGAERLGDPGAIPILEKLHSHPALRDLMAKKGFQADYVIERRAMCELAIGKAMARCGSAKGYAMLIAYLDDNRAQLAELAHSNLALISGKDFGKDAAAWTAWLDKSKGALPACPLKQDLDAAYGDEMLFA